MEGAARQRRDEGPYRQHARHGCEDPARNEQRPARPSGGAEVRHLQDGCPRDRRNRHQEGERRRLTGFDAEPQGRDHGSARAGDSRHDGDRLRQPDEQSSHPSRDGLIRVCHDTPAAPKERSGHQQREAGHGWNLEQRLEEASTEHSCQPCGDRGHCQEAQVANGALVPGERASYEVRNTGSVHDQDRNQRRDVDRDLEQDAR